MTEPESTPDEAAELEVEITELSDVGDLQACVDLQRAIWRASDVELVPASQMRAAQHAGGLVAGAWIEGELIGFCYGFPAFRPKVRRGPGLHSHMTGVRAVARGRGVGRRLKEFQRDWCLARGYGWVEWTFDPLRAANARFNLEHLGATAGEYLVDTYGVLEDGLNSGLESDRLMAFWDLTTAEPRRLTPPAAGVEPVLVVDGLGRPGEPQLGSQARMVSVAVPPDLDDLLDRDVAVVAAWRLASRTALKHYLERGYVAERFLRGAYRLRRRPEE